MISVKKDIENQTIAVVINNTSITVSLGEWSRMIAREVPIYGLVQNLA